MVGPIFVRELVTAPRSPSLYLARGVYAAALITLMCTAWLVLTGTQPLKNTGDFTRFSVTLFQLLAPLQVATLSFLAAFSAASAVAQEKDRRTLPLLLVTRLSAFEIVVGKLLASLLQSANVLLAGLPVFAALTVFGGVAAPEVGRVLLVSLGCVVAAGSLGGAVAFAREKTFQSLALTAILLSGYTAATEGGRLAALTFLAKETAAARVLEALSPIAAVQTAATPTALAPSAVGPVGPTLLFAAAMFGIAIVINALAVWRFRAWNPSREVRKTRPETRTRTPPTASSEPAADRDEEDRTGHIDDRGGRALEASPARTVWRRPVLWRETRTRAYGRKMIVIRVLYWLLLAAAAGAVLSPWAEETVAAPGVITLSPASRIVAPFALISLAIVNALAVTSITSERDGRTLDLLLATDISPKEFVFGKLFGVFYVTKEMILGPLVMAMLLWWLGRLSLEQFCYAAGGVATLVAFVGMLGLHCGMTYASSRTAIAVSLGVVFFLFLGVATLIFLMISFSGSFQVQLAPFLAFILGGGVGLYAALGVRNPSAAIGLAAVCIPFATFYAVVSFLRGYDLPVFVVVAAAYAFTTAALGIPAIFEFDVEMGRTGGDGGEE